MSNPSTDEELRQFLRQRISGISTAAEDDVLAVINKEKVALLDELEAQAKEWQGKYVYITHMWEFIEEQRAKLTKEDK